MKKYIYVIMSFVLFVVFLSTSYATSEVSNSGSLNNLEVKTKTIKELKEDLAGLKDEKKEINTKWNQLNKINGKVVDFLKENLTQGEIDIIEELSITFQKDKKTFETKLKELSEDNSEELKKSFIKAKLNFYKNIVPFIDLTKKESYLIYIKGSITIEKENKDIKEKIYKQEEAIENRVDTIKETIKKHKKTLEKKLEVLIREKIGEKINHILASKQMQVLDNNNKVIILKKIIERLDSSKNKLSKEYKASDIGRKKIEIYNIAEELINEKINLIIK